jgi:uncharacterized protein (TIGR03083 family)
MDTWKLVDAERKDNVALLEGLSPEQWDVASLCGEWRVRDVAAHMSAGANIQPLHFMRLLASNGFNFNKANAAEAVERGSGNTIAIVEQYRQTIGSRKKPPGTKAVTVLNDMVVHGQDIRRPLGISRAIAEDRVRSSLDFVKGSGWPYGAKKRVAGLRLEATDMDWTHGEGPVVRGTGEALLMILNGRADALKDVDGPGKDLLAARMS